MLYRKKITEKNNEIKGSDLIGLSLYAFAGLGTEAVYAYLLEPVIYGASMENWSEAQTIVHWILTCATWAVFAIILIKTAEKKHRFPLLKKGEPAAPWRWALCLLLILLALAADYISWGGFKIYLEYVRRGPLLFIFQYIYYAFETMLFLLIIVFGQRACEIWFARTSIPYGGIICGLTWGLAHVFTKDFLTGIMGLVLGFGMGSVYLLINRDLKKAGIVLFFMFIV